MKREKELLLRMAGTIATIVICLVAMGYSAFAYFSHSVSSGMNVIQSAHFDVVVTLVGVKDAEGDAGEATGAEAELIDEGAPDSNEMVLEGNRLSAGEAKVYIFKIEASGDAQTGYCKIVIGKTGAGQQVYYTTQLYQQPDEGQISSLIIEIDMTKASGYTIEFVPRWGTSSYYVGDQVELLGENDKFVISFEPATSTNEEMAGSGEISPTEGESAADEEVVYTIVFGDTLYSIAQRYGLNWHELAEYNQIPDETKIVPGQVLKIPPSKGEAEPEETMENATEPAGEVQS